MNSVSSWEASVHARWFERLKAELNIELSSGDAAEIRAKRVRKQKTDREDGTVMTSGLYGENPEGDEVKGDSALKSFCLPDNQHEG